MNILTKNIFALFILVALYPCVQARAPRTDQTLNQHKKAVIQSNKEGKAHIDTIKKLKEQEKNAVTQQAREQYQRALEDEYEKSLSYLQRARRSVFGEDEKAKEKMLEAIHNKRKFLYQLQQEEKRYDTLITIPEQQASERKQAILKNKIYLEEIVAGQRFTGVQKNLLKLIGAAGTAYALYNYGPERIRYFFSPESLTRQATGYATSAIAGYAISAGLNKLFQSSAITMEEAQEAIKNNRNLAIVPALVDVNTAKVINLIKTPQEQTP